MILRCSYNCFNGVNFDNVNKIDKYKVKVRELCVEMIFKIIYYFGICRVLKEWVNILMLLKN